MSRPPVYPEHWAIGMIVTAGWILAGLVLASGAGAAWGLIHG